MTAIAGVRLFTAALVGLAYAYVGVLFWSYDAGYNPILEWHQTTLALEGQEAKLCLAIYGYDLFANILIAVPFAYPLAALAPENSWPNLCIALASAFIATYWDALLNLHFWVMVLGSGHGLASLFVFVLALPIAFIASVFVRKRLLGASTRH